MLRNGHCHRLEGKIMNSTELIRPRRERQVSVSLSGGIDVVYGIHRLAIDISGLKVCESRLALRDIVNMRDDACAFINGRRVFSEEVVLQVGQQLEFVKWRGRKGSDECIRRIALALEKIGNTLDEISASEKRIAEHFDPQKRSTVGTKYLAERIGCSVRWAGDLVRNGEIPSSCICPRSGNGGYWRFWKDQLDKWIEER